MVFEKKERVINCKISIKDADDSTSLWMPGSHAFDFMGAGCQVTRIHLSSPLRVNLLWPTGPNYLEMKALSGCKIFSPKTMPFIVKKDSGSP